MQDTFLLGCVPVNVRHNTSSHVIHFIGHLWRCLPCLQVSALFTLKSMHNFLGFLGKTYTISKQISDTHDDCTICISTSIHRCILMPKILSIMLYKCFFRIELKHLCLCSQLTNHWYLSKLIWFYHPMLLHLICCIWFQISVSQLVSI